MKHFDRKREYLKFKDRIQNDGFEPLDRIPKSVWQLDLNTIAVNNP